MREFTLVELMIVVAIIAILAAIAIPGFAMMSYKAKRAELEPNVEGIWTAAMAYEVAYDYDWALGPATIAYPHVPAWPPTKSRAGWTSGSFFDDLEWAPDGDVYGRYCIYLTPMGSFSPPCGTCPVGPAGEPCVNGFTDVDGGGTEASASRYSGGLVSPSPNVY